MKKTTVGIALAFVLLGGCSQALDEGVGTEAAPLGSKCKATRCDAGASACVPTTCAAQGKDCGSISDGCGGTLTCGTCTSPATCGGGGVAGVCGGGTSSGGTSSGGTSSGGTSSVVPLGVAGTWTLVFDDEFDGTALDTTKWSPNWFGEGGKMNNVGTYAANVSVSGGNLLLTLASSTSGALVHTGYGTGRYQLPVGGYTEARVYFPGSTSYPIYNWPAWWASGPSWPAAGEHDIAEGLGGSLTVNYHSPSGAHNQGAVAGSWGSAFHVYGLHRKATSADVYWDGNLVKSYATDDNGAGEELILNVGSSGTVVTGNASTVMVDYVRAWK